MPEVQLHLETNHLIDEMFGVALYTRPPVAEGEQLYGMSPPAFDLLARYLLTSSAQRGSFAGGRIIRDGGSLLVTHRPGGRSTRVATISYHGAIIDIADRTESAPFVKVAERLVLEGLLVKTQTGRYARPGIFYVEAELTEIPSVFASDLWMWIVKRYRDGNPKDTVIARAFSMRVREDGTAEYAFSRQNMMSVRDTGDGKTISYMTKDRYNRGNQTFQEAKPVTFIKKALADWAQEGLTDRDFENFDTAWKAAFTINDELTFLSGEKIRWAYLADNHSPKGGAYSCMSGHESQKDLDIYVRNPGQVELAVILDGNNLVVARCLVWTDDTGQRWYDRIYATEKHSRFMESQFKEMGILSMQLDKRSFAARITLSDPWVERQPPYLDTVRWINIDGTLRREDDGSGQWIAVGSSYIREGWPACPSCGERVSVKDLPNVGSAVKVPCSTCLAAMLANPETERINLTTQVFKANDIATANGGLVSYDNKLWVYDRASQCLVRVGETNG